MTSVGSPPASSNEVMDRKGTRFRRRGGERVILDSNWLYGESLVYEPSCRDDLGTSEPSDVDSKLLGQQLRAVDESGIDDPAIMADPERREVAMEKVTEVIRQAIARNSA